MAKKARSENRPRPVNSRLLSYALSWVLLFAALLLPLPTTGVGPEPIFPLSFVVFFKADEWLSAYPSMLPGIHFAGLMLFAISMFTHVVFVSTRDNRKLGLSRTYKILLIGSLAINASLLLFFPFLGLLIGYWLWLLAFAALAWTFLKTPADPPSTAAAPAGSTEDGATKDVPTLLWVWLGFVIFWIGVETMGQWRAADPSASRMASPKDQALASYVNDPANLLKADDQFRLDNLLEKFEKETSNQIAVAIYPNLPTTPLEEFTIRIAELSRLGRKGLDNGAILFIFRDDRAARLEVGYGLEGALTDFMAHRILAEKLAPRLTRGEMAGGIDATLAALTGEVRDAYRGDRMPGTLARSFKQIKVAFSTLFTLPQLLGIPLYERFMDSLMGGVVGLFMFRGFRTFWRVGRAIGVGTVNLFRRQKIDAGSRLNMDEGDTNLMVITSLLSMLIGVFIFGIVVVIAAGGTFGGAGAGIQW